MTTTTTTTTMRAAVYHQYGGPEVVQIADVPKPRPAANELLIRVRATTVSAGDWRARTLTMPPGFGAFARPVFGFWAPRQPILGTELAGEVESIGAAVTRFKVGDAVFAFTGIGMGCHAEYRTVREDGRVAAVPAGMSWEQAASLSFGGVTALGYLRGRVKAGDEVLVVGASGAVGCAAVQLAKNWGAKVTGVTSTANMALVRELGADDVIDYTTTSFAQQCPGRYDLIYDTVGATTFAAAKAALKPDGRLIHSSAGLYELLRSVTSNLVSRQQVLVAPGAERPGDLCELAALAGGGRYRGVVDRTYALERVRDAHAYVATGRKRGSVVVTL